MFAYQISRHGGPEVLEWVEIPTPEPGAHEVLVRVRACALNHLDIWVRRGVEGHTFPLPIVPGSEISGDIAALGSEVHDLTVGDATLVAPGLSCELCDRCLGGKDHLCRKYSILGEDRNGGYAEYVLVPRRNILPHPVGLSYVQSAAFPLVFLTAWHMLIDRAHFMAGEDVLIHAAGSGVSTAAIQIADLVGARKIIVTASSQEKLDKALELGATHTIQYSEEDFVQSTRRITNKRGVDVVLDHVGGETFERSLSALGSGGRLVLCGATTEHLATVNLRAVFFKNLSILGSTMGSLAELIHLLSFFDQGRLKPVVDRTIALEEAPKAQLLLESRKSFGKIVLTVGDDQIAKKPPHG